MKLIITKNKSEAVNKTASVISELIRKKPNAVLGLATGETMIPLYKELVSHYKKGKIDFSQIRTFNLDEYAGIKLGNKNSFHSYMDKYLFSKIKIKKQNIHFPSSDAKAYEKEIKKSGGIDLCLLGIGENGHIAFNEPGSSFKNITRKVITADSRQAYTMGIKTIMNSRKIVLLAFGAKKAKAIAESIKGKITEKVPASILKRHKNSFFIIDKPASSKL
jgi:glucosamine-6-phosphate deaminase